MNAADPVIVSGATYGIGWSVLVRLAARGYAVVGFGLRGHPAQPGVDLIAERQQSLPPRAALLEADVASPDDVDRVVDFTVGKFGGVYGLVNNAAVRPVGTILDTDPHVWEQTMAVNLRGPYLCMRAVLPHMLLAGRGSIINIGSGSGFGRPGQAAYAASKGGLHTLSQAVAYDARVHGVRVNTVIPGATASGMTEVGISQGIFTAPSETGWGLTSERQGSAPSDVAAAVDFLLSDEASAISGAVLNVGGFAQQGG